jgi:hypothetical protein
MRSLGFEIAGVLALKLVGLAVLYLAFFAHPLATASANVVAHVLKG